MTSDLADKPSLYVLVCGASSFGDYISPACKSPCFKWSAFCAVNLDGHLPVYIRLVVHKDLFRLRDVPYLWRVRAWGHKHDVQAYLCVLILNHRIVKVLYGLPLEKNLCALAMCLPYQYVKTHHGRDRVRQLALECPGVLGCSALYIKSEPL